MTTSISYRRYLRTAMAIDAHRKTNARLCNTDSHPGGLANTEETRNETTRSAAAVTNHLSCSRSSPTERRYRMITATSATTNDARRKMYRRTNAPPPFEAWENGW